jgi:hypothetical protein
MKQVNQVGADVDSEELVCAMQRTGQRMPLATFANSGMQRAKTDAVDAGGILEYLERMRLPRPTTGPEILQLQAINQ